MLDQRNTLKTWSITTGKLLCQYKIKSMIDFTKYQVFCRVEDSPASEADEVERYWFREWTSPNVLVRSIEPVEYKEEDYYIEDTNQTSIEKNNLYRSLLAKKYYDCKILTILNEKEMKEQCNFIQVFESTENFLRIYFSDDLQYMLERQQNQKVFIKKRVDYEGGFCKWKSIIHLKQFPMDLSELCQANFLFSPDLMYHLDYDKTLNVFTIKDTLTQMVYKNIPTGLMNPKKEKVQDIARRFKWIDNTKIMVINNEGMEKIIDVKNNFAEIGYGVVPHFRRDLDKYFNFDGDAEGAADKLKNYHYYFNQRFLKYQSTFKRLLRRYRCYINTFYLQNQREMLQIYDTLFDVEYNTKTTQLEKMTYKF